MNDTIYRQVAIDEICISWCGCKHEECVHISDFKLGCYWCDGCSDVKDIIDLPSAQPIDVQEAYYRGKIDGIKECMARLKKVNEEFANE